MKGRDLLILAAVVLVAGFAVADALRGDGSARRPQPGTEAERTTTGDTPPAADSDLGRKRFDPIPGAPGTVVFTEAGDCPVREFEATSGTELPNVIAQSTCELWAAPVTAKVAVGVAPARGDAVPFRFVDLSRGSRDLGESSAFLGFLLWSPDGQRAAWCNGRRVGVDLELGASRRRLAQCPTAYTLDSEVAFANGRRLVVGSRTVVRASDSVTYAQFGEDGSVAVGVEGRRIERYLRGRLVGAVDLEGPLVGRVPTFSPDNCAATIRSGSNSLQVLDLGCSPVPPDTALPGYAAAWSPDRRWLAVAEPDAITFYDLFEMREPVQWPITAISLAWRH